MAKPETPTAERPETRERTLGTQIGGTIGEAIGTTIGEAIDLATGTVGMVGKAFGLAFHLPGLHRRHPTAPRPAPGTKAGIEHLPDLDVPPEPGRIHVRCIDYSPERVEARDVEDLAAFLKEPQPEWVKTRWVNIDGLHPYVVNQVKDAYGFHTLAAEDVLHVPQRPRAEPYSDHLFVVAHLMMMHDGHVASEQVSFFLKPPLLVTFQERPGDIWQPIRERINADGSRIRANNASYLLYALLDAIVDHCFPILERYGDTLEDLETRVLEEPGARMQQQIHTVKRELIVLRRLMWPMREVINQLQRDEQKIISRITKTYLRDVYEHTVQAVDIIETFRDVAGGLTDLYMSAMSNRMNEIMKVLTIMATLFIPTTFIAGIYGMNFRYMPELAQPWGYPAVLVGCALIMGGMLLYFRRKGWLGGP